VRKIKYRQKLKDAYVSRYGEVFHYWGYIDEGFVSPVGLNVSSEESEQFIGRRDSNYADLYEGDVIYDHVGRGVIKWWETNNAFKVSYVDGNKGHGKWFADYTLKELESILKIGNIHENKELLCED
jgi:hypothetical protein